MIELLVKIITPSQCLICAEQNKLICEECEFRYLESLPPTCYSCAARSEDFKTCKKCKASKIRPVHVWCTTSYNQTAKKLVYQMKFDARREVAQFMAKRLDQALPYFAIDAVTFVPTATKRIRQRGYDHAKLIAQEVAKIRRLPVKKLLIRLGASRQVGVSRTERQKQALAAYKIAIKQLPDRVLLIDDVISTGATIEAATACLRRAGVKKVYVAALARRLR